MRTGESITGAVAGAGARRVGLAAQILAVIVAGVAPVPAQNGLILDQQLDENGKGYTVIRVWGSHYEMGYAQAELLGDAIVQGVNETEAYLDQWAMYDYVRGIMANAVWMPPGIEDEFDAAVDCLAITHPEEGIDELDLKVTCTAGEWLYGCRSHTCWGRYVSEPTETLSTRRLDFSSLYASMNHHVLCARDPDDGSPRWVNLGWARLDHGRDQRPRRSADRVWLLNPRSRVLCYTESVGEQSGVRAHLWARVSGTRSEYLVYV